MTRIQPEIPFVLSGPEDKLYFPMDAFEYINPI